MKDVNTTPNSAAVHAIAIVTRTYLLARCFASGTLTGGLLGSGHGDGFVFSKSEVLVLWCVFVFLP